MKNALLFVFLSFFATLQILAQTATAPTTGDGSAGNPYQIATIENLYWLTQQQGNSDATGLYWQRNYVQTADIDASASSGWGAGAGFTPIGNNSELFEGTYNGGGHTISGIFINLPDATAHNAAPFAYIHTTAIIKNLGIINADITGSSGPGNKGTSCLVGENHGTIQNCYATGTASATYNVGGLVGYSQSGTISNSYANVEVTGFFIGGILGVNNFGTVTNCYSFGIINSPGGFNNGFVGFNNGSTNTNCFWDVTTSGTSSSGDDNGAVTGKTTAEMKNVATFTDETTVGLTTAWDFVGNPNDDGGNNDYWNINSQINNGYPYLMPPHVTWTGTTSTAWATNTNWDGDILPTVVDGVIVPDVSGASNNFPVIASGVGAYCKNLTVDASASLTLNSGGSLITAGTIINNGTFNAEKILGYDTWYLTSSPVANAVSGIFEGFYLQNWDESAGLWSDITSLTETLTPTKGYGVYIQSAGKPPGETFTFSGTPNTGNQSLAITYTEVSGKENDGTNLLGNPYPSYLDWDLVSGYGSKYTWNGTAYDAYTQTGSYGTGSQYVAPMEGFFVVVNSAGTFSLTDAMRTQQPPPDKKEGNKNLSNGLVLAASNGSYEDVLWIVFEEEAAAGFELARDAWKIQSGTEGLSQLWSVSTDGKLAVDVRPEQESIQLGFTNDQEGIYSIGIKEIADISTAILEDTKENIFHDLTQSDYSFNWSLNDDETRFKLHLNTTAIAETDINTLKVFVSGGMINISSNTPAERIILSNITGQILSIYEGSESIPAPKIAGVYLVSVESEGQRRTQKIIVN